MRYFFDDCVLDTDRRELRRGTELVAVEPQVFDVLLHLIRNRDRVVTRDDLLGAVWEGRIVSDSALTTRINAVRQAIGDSGEKQRLVKTLLRKGFRFVGTVREEKNAARESAVETSGEYAWTMRRARHDLPLDDKRSRAPEWLLSSPCGVRLAYEEKFCG